MFPLYFQCLQWYSMTKCSIQWNNTILDPWPVGFYQYWWLRALFSCPVYHFDTNPLRTADFCLPTMKTVCSFRRGGKTPVHPARYTTRICFQRPWLLRVVNICNIPISSSLVCSYWAHGTKDSRLLCSVHFSYNVLCTYAGSMTCRSDYYRFSLSLSKLC